ncbi:hypothetical protein [Pseudomonas phage 71PfluR64PP]|uniref:Uncharacterized protein n=2 Tax=Pifdecavirus pv22PfluR64PP TaxID=2733656 RepID=A0A2S1PGV7_9CAUD|nr:hypothetical protein [Pseudomonas phage 71PfluR64PP]AWH15778.1 hypothetical protein [Pseudomonas phage 67PfluR64PP]
MSIKVTLKQLRNFDLVQALLAAAGRLQAKRVARLRAREAALTATIRAASEALVDTQKARIDEQYRDLRVIVK